MCFEQYRFVSMCRPRFFRQILRFSAFYRCFAGSLDTIVLLHHQLSDFQLEGGAEVFGFGHDDPRYRSLEYKGLSVLS